MMSRPVWSRQAPLPGRDGTGPEIWTRTDSAGSRAYPLDVRIGKPFDVTGLKGTDLSETRDYEKFLRETAARLYAPGAPRRVLAQCPACLGDAGPATIALSPFGVPYMRCAFCGHGFVREQPAPETLTDLFAQSDTHASTYIDKEGAERRITAIVQPKLEYGLDLFQRHAGRKAQSLIDVGAGGGHFVAAASRAGLKTTGYEQARASRAFAKEAFGVELSDADFLADAPAPVDIVTFWGLLEYLAEPRAFIARARQRLIPGQGLLLIEIPRLDAVATAAQSLPGAVIARHMDPTTHVNTFSDESLLTAVTDSGFAPVALWYFGMDAYELVVQLGLMLGQDQALSVLAPVIPRLQAAFDAGRQCDDLILAAVPV